MGITGGFAAMGAMTAVSAYSTAQGQKAQAIFTKSQYDSNAKIAGAQADSARAAGDLKAGQMAEQTKMNVASQKVASAATGANANAGSALELQQDTKWQGAQNEIQIRNNAWRTAWGYGIQATDYTTQGEFASIAGANAAANTLLTGGMQAASFGLNAASSYRKYNGSTLTASGGGSGGGSNSSAYNSDGDGYLGVNTKFSTAY